MGKRGKTIFGAGTWALPGGHLENLERVEDCVRRELTEEVGIKPVRMELLGVINDIPTLKGQVRHYVRFVYLIKEFSGEVRNLEPERCEGWEWVDKSKTPSPLFVGHFKTLEFYKSKGRPAVFES